MRPFRVAASVALALVGGCTAVASLDDHIGDLATDAQATDAQATDGSVTGDGPAVGDDGAADAGPEVDCQPGYACTAGAVPAGWNVVAYSAASRPLCPTGYTAPGNAWVSDAGAPPLVCACNCNVTTFPDCQGATVTLFGYTDNGCTANESVLGTFNNPGGNCMASAPFTMPGAAHRITVGVPAGGACGSGATVTSRLDASAAEGLGCQLTAPPVAGCTSDRACVPKIAPPFATCIAKVGDEPTCPPGFTTRTLVGTGTNDTRTCTGTGCACQLNRACGNSTFLGNTTMTGAVCSGTTVSVPTTCKVETTSLTFNAQHLSTDAGASTCTPSGTPTMTGKVDLTNKTTVCCP
jgi:hypothetical protein